MNGPLAIFRQPPGALFVSKFFDTLSRARLRHHRCSDHSSSRRYFSSLLSRPSSRPYTSFYPLKEGPRMGNEGVIDGIRVTQSTDPTASTTNRNELYGEQGDLVNRQSLNWYWYTEAVKNVIKLPTPSALFALASYSQPFCYTPYGSQTLAEWILWIVNLQNSSHFFVDLAIDFALCFL